MSLSEGAPRNRPTGTNFYFDRVHLIALAAGLRDQYATASPFPHVVIDDFLPAEVLREVLAEFPTPDEIEWWTFNDHRERKLGTRDESDMGPATRHLIAQLNSAPVLDFLQELTGIPGLVPDPALYGGGLHQIEPGGFLKVHADFNLHPVTGLERRLNLLIYLNEDWPPEFGGDLELWPSDMGACGRRIAPLFNRCVIFTTSDESFHGHPDPLRCPEGVTRKSVALYYYSLPVGPRERRVARNTDFRGRPGEAIDVGPRPKPSWDQVARRLASRWLPPVVADGVRSAMRSRRDRSE